MTQPTPHGFPDWGRFQAQADTILLSVLNQTPGVSVDYSIGFVGGYEAVGVHLVASTFGSRFRFRYFEDAAFASFITEHEFSVGAGIQHDSAHPILGPFLRVTVVPSNVSAVHSLTLWSAPSSAFPLNSSLPRNLLIERTNAAVGANATVDAPSTAIWPTMAHWTVFSNSPDWRAELHLLSAAGAISRIDIMKGNDTTERSHTVFLSGFRPQVRFINNDAAARQFWTYLVGRPIGPGY